MKKILIIEDDSAIAEIEKDYLTLSGLDAAIITDGKKGLEEAQSGLYDLILLDLMLPGTDGFSICRRLRERLDIPILIVSARRDDIDKIRSLGFGADDYIEKTIFSRGTGRPRKITACPLRTTERDGKGKYRHHHNRRHHFKPIHPHRHRPGRKQTAPQ